MRSFVNLAILGTRFWELKNAVLKASYLVKTNTKRLKIQTKYFQSTAAVRRSVHPSYNRTLTSQTMDDFFHFSVKRENENERQRFSDLANEQFVRFEDFRRRWRRRPSAQTHKNGAKFSVRLKTDRTHKSCCERKKGRVKSSCKTLTPHSHFSVLAAYCFDFIGHNQSFGLGLAYQTNFGPNGRSLDTIDEITLGSR